MKCPAKDHRRRRKKMTLFPTVADQVEDEGMATAKSEVEGAVVRFPSEVGALPQPLRAVVVVGFHLGGEGEIAIDMVPMVGAGVGAVAGAGEGSEVKMAEAGGRDEEEAAGSLCVNVYTVYKCIQTPRGFCGKGRRREVEANVRFL